MRVRVKTIPIDHSPGFDPYLEAQVNAFIAEVEEIAAHALGASAPGVVAVHVTIEKIDQDSSVATIILSVN